MDTNIIAQLILGLLYVLLSVAVFVFVLFVSRELTAWYFKTNEIIALLKQIADGQNKK